jgi:predicted nucleotidyltransferase
MKEKLEEICKKRGIISLYAFGSRAKEVYNLLKGKRKKLKKSSSDLDVAVVPKEGFFSSARERVEFCLELEDLFGAERVDLVVLPEASTFLALEAIRGEILYCDDEIRQAREEIYYLRKAADLAFYKDKYFEEMLNGEILI